MAYIDHSKTNHNKFQNKKAHIITFYTLRTTFSISLYYPYLAYTILFGKGEPCSIYRIPTCVPNAKIHLNATLYIIHHLITIIQQ